MKKSIHVFTWATLLLFNTVDGQTTITAANMPLSGDTIRYSNCATSSISYTTTGADFYWNYDSLKAQSQGVYNYLAASKTPYAFYFTGAGEYGLKIADSIGTGTYTFKNVFDFYKNSSASFETEGIGFEYSGFPLAAFYSDPDEIYTFPLAYLNHDSTTYKFTVALGSTIYYSQLGYRINDVDGWGYIKTPYDDSVACLHLVSTTYGKDSINYNGIGFTFPDVQRSYKWVSMAEKIPVLEVDGSYTNNKFIPTQARYRDSYKNLAGIETHLSNTDIKVFPNPTSGDLHVYTNSPEITTLNLFNVSGILVGSYKTNGTITTIPTQNLNRGCYYYSIISQKAGQIATGKVIIVN